MAALVASLVGLSVAPTTAGADEIANKRAQAAALAAQIAQQQQQVEVLSNQYDGAVLHVQQVESQLAATKQDLAKAAVEVRHARAQVAAEAIRAYTNGGYYSPPGTAALSGRIEPLLEQAYLQTVVGTQTDAIDQLHAAEDHYTYQQHALQQADVAAHTAVSNLAATKDAVVTANNQAEATLSQVNGQIATLVAQAQAQAAAALRAQQQAALAAQIAQQQAAQRDRQLAVASAQNPPPATQAPAVQTPSAPAVATTSPPAAGGNSQAPVVTAAPTAPSAPVTTAPPAVVPAQGGGVSAAISVAMAQIGKPYQWGAAGPSSFDCSGLVMYAFAAAGISLPHYTVSQWDDTVHIPLADLQPGDLVFFDGLNHVGIYIGGGDMVDAPHTGAFVRVEPIYGFGSIDGATRVE